MLHELSDLATHTHQIQEKKREREGREKEREVTDHYQINKLWLEIYVFSYSLLKLRVSLIEL